MSHGGTLPAAVGAAQQIGTEWVQCYSGCTIRFASLGGPAVTRKWLRNLQLAGLKQSYFKAIRTGQGAIR